MFISGWRQRVRVVVAIIGLALITCILYLDAGLRENTLNYVVKSWFYVSGLTRYDFHPTPEEQACFNGTSTRINASALLESIPRVVHFITGVDGPNPITIITWLAVRAAAANLGPDVEIRLHYVFLSEEGPWWADVRDRVILVRHDLGFLDDFLHIVPPPIEWHPAHKADILRLQILRSEGGIYLDSDVILLRSLDALLSGRRDVIMGYEGGHRKGMCNAVILARKRARFLEIWYRAYDRFDPNDWNYHSVILPAKLVANNKNDICPLSPAAFFWPLWTDDQVAWMHRPLAHNEAADVAAAIERNGGALFPGQLAYHATGARKHMTATTAQEILTEDTRFNMLVRKYVDLK